jgi:hypothetical protein
MLCTMKTSKGNTNSYSELNFETLKTFKGFENMTEQQAQKEIEVIKRLAKILHHLITNENNSNEQEQSNEYENG